MDALAPDLGLPSKPDLLDAAGAAQLLETAYPKVSPGAVAKDIGCIGPHMREFIALSPFCCLATSDGEGRLDVTPRGDKPGFIKVLDDFTVALPDRPGNNRLDSLRNVVRNPGVGLLIMIPGFEETLRINGAARLSVDDRLMSAMEAEGKKPRSVMVIAVAEAYLHCAKAFRRSRLWEAGAQTPRSALPSLSSMIVDQLKLPREDVPERERRLEEAYKATMW